MALQRFLYSFSAGFWAKKTLANMLNNSTDILKSQMANPKKITGNELIIN